MTLSEAMAQHGPAWLSIWLPILLLGAFVLPLVLLIWKSTRIAAVISVVASVLGGIGVNVLFDKLGYVKLLGLPHIVVWTPLVIFLLMKMRSVVVPKAAKLVIAIVVSVILISLVFDIIDVAKYVLGDRTPAM